MATLRARMARHGFESNDDYAYRVRCLLGYRTQGLRCLLVEGDSGRRKTAFANALAHALGWDQVLYHDFTAGEALPGRVEVPNIEDAEGEAPVRLTRFDRTMSEACAYSEAASTILILDQLQAAEFSDHLRLYRFVRSTEWRYPLATLNANRRRFLLVLVSEAPVFHSLHKECFRIWTDPEHPPARFRADDYALDAAAQPLLDALGDLFAALGASPTPSEFTRILHDVLQQACTVEHLRQSIYGWTENLTWDVLHRADLAEPLDAVARATQDYLGQDRIELVGEPERS